MQRINELQLSKMQIHTVSTDLCCFQNRVISASSCWRSRSLRFLPSSCICSVFAVKIDNSEEDLMMLFLTLLGSRRQRWRARPRLLGNAERGSILENQLLDVP